MTYKNGTFKETQTILLEQQKKSTAQNYRFHNLFKKPKGE